MCVCVCEGICVCVYVYMCMHVCVCVRSCVYVCVGVRLDARVCCGSLCLTLNVDVEKAVTHVDLMGKPLLVFFNKQDLRGIRTADHLWELLQLDSLSLKGLRVHAEESSAITGYVCLTSHCV
jgi:hypothetical protein